MTQSEWVPIFLDRTPPTVEIARPSGGFASGNGFVVGTIADAQLSHYTVELASGAEPDQELAEAPAILALDLGFASTDPTTIEPWKDLFAENTVATDRMAAPLLVTQGTADTIVWPEVTEGYVKALCDAGATVELKTYAGVDHFGVRTASAPDVVRWLGERFAGQPAPSTCGA